MTVLRRDLANPRPRNGFLLHSPILPATRRPRGFLVSAPETDEITSPAERKDLPFPLPGPVRLSGAHVVTTVAGGRRGRAARARLGCTASRGEAKLPPPGLDWGRRANTMRGRVPGSLYCRVAAVRDRCHRGRASAAKKIPAAFT